MRIVGGKWRGAPLVSPGGHVRPSREDLREALFAALTSDSPLRNARDPWPPLTDAKVLDLFAGTGSLGLEALSRGAACCDFVEDGPSALHALKANIAARRLAPLAKGTRPSGKHQAARLFKRDAIPFSAALSAHSSCEIPERDGEVATPVELSVRRSSREPDPVLRVLGLRRHRRARVRAGRERDSALPRAARSKGEGKQT